MKTIKNVLLLSVVSLFSFGSDTAGAQTQEQQLKTATMRLFSRIDQKNMLELKLLVSKDIEVIDSAYPLRIEGWTEYADYLINLREDIPEFKTSVRQLTVRIIGGSAAVVSFYYTQDYRDAERPSVQDTDVEDPTDEDSIFPEGTDEVGRGTIVFVQEINKWKAVTIHLSQFPLDMF